MTRTVLAGALGLGDDPQDPTLSGPEQRYLTGFVRALDWAPPDGDLPVLPPDAPFEPDHALWVNGVLAGLYSRAPTPAVAAGGSEDTGGTEETAREVVVLWASQTGSAEEFATGPLVEKVSGSVRAPTVMGMDGATLDSLPADADLLVVSSTFGDGDAPDNGATFWEALGEAEDGALAGHRFAVLAYGDSSYDEFCGHGKNLDVKLAALGATRMLERVEVDVDDEDSPDQWLERVVGVLQAEADDVSDGPDSDSSDSYAISPAPTLCIAPSDSVDSSGARSTPATIAAPLVENRLLTGSGGTKEIRRFTFDLTDTGISYQAGDSLSVTPLNRDDLVLEWLEVTGVDPNSEVEVKGETVQLCEAFRERIDITSISRNLVRFVADRADRSGLDGLLGNDKKEELDEWVWGRQAIDLLLEYPVEADAQEWIDVLGALRARQYSISSSSLIHPEHVSLTVSVVRFAGPTGKRRSGVCSSFLADVPNRTKVQIKVQPAPQFAPPGDADTPMIMIGPGTGIAPFIGFLDERRARGDRAPNWLFFGEQNEETDFYYRHEISALRDEGVLTDLDLAFSRDQGDKVYVQHRMLENGPKLWKWIDDGAALYVCGDASRMAKDVDQALRDLVAEHGGLSSDDADAYVKKMSSEKRYLRDVY